MHLTGLNFMTLNCRSLRKKTAELKVLLIDNKIDIVLLQETWLQKADKSIYFELKEMGYKVSKLERTLKKGGGLLTLVHSEIQTKVSTFFNYKYEQFENIVNVFKLAKHKIIIANIYRPPWLSKSKFLTQFNEFICKLIEHDGILVISGDFNINILQKNTTTNLLLKLLKDNGLTQLIMTPTREGALLDFVIVSTCYVDHFKSLFPIAHFNSDHKPLFTSLSISFRKVTKPLHCSIRDYKSINIEQLRDCIKGSTLTNIDSFISPDECVDAYNTQIERIVKQHCPSKKIVFKHDKTERWFNSDLQILKKEKRKYERLYRKSPQNQVYLNKYRQCRNIYTLSIKQARNSFFSNKIKNNHNDPKGLYKVLNELSGNKKEVILPSNNSEQETAEKMSQFYTDKVDKIRNHISSELSSYSNPTLFSLNSKTKEYQNSFTCLKELSYCEVESIISNLKKKSCILDPAPISVVMHIIDLLYPLILKTINLSIHQATFPCPLKKAVVSPILKNPSLDSEVFQNYRPVSSIPFLSKVLERAIFQQLYNYLETNQLFSIYQSAYRSNHSCETAITKLIDDLQKFQSHQENNSILILLDQSAAFDTVDHHILLTKLEEKFGIKDNALKLIRSYLENREYSVKIRNCLSSSKILKYGVPQGSLLGPIFYILYVHEVEQIAIKHGFNIQVYADDCQLYTSFQNHSINNLELKLKTCLDEIKEWMSQNYLKLNPDKTLLKIFWNGKLNPTIDKILHFDLHLNVKVLGVKLDSCFNFDSFIAHKVKICNMHLRNLWNIRECLDTSTRTLMISNLVLSTIDYCNILLINCSDSALRPLKLIINRSIRFILNLRYRTHISPYYPKLHFLTIRNRIIFKACLLAYKIFYRLSPSYLEENSKRFTPTLQHMQLREGTGRDVYMFVSKLQTDNSLTNSIHLHWNKLPLPIRKCTTISTFKKKLKSYLMFKV